jgi:hypothetical protein
MKENLNDQIPKIKQKEEPLYVNFNHNGIIVSELLIPTEDKNLDKLFLENAEKYKISPETFLELVYHNKINLSKYIDNDNNDNSDNDKNNENNINNKNNNKEISFDKKNTLIKGDYNFTDRNDKINSYSTRTNLSKTKSIKSVMNFVPTLNIESPKENFYESPFEKKRLNENLINNNNIDMKRELIDLCKVKNNKILFINDNNKAKNTTNNNNYIKLQKLINLSSKGKENKKSYLNIANLNKKNDISNNNKNSNNKNDISNNNKNTNNKNDNTILNYNNLTNNKYKNLNESNSNTNINTNNCTNFYFNTEININETDRNIPKKNNSISKLLNSNKKLINININKSNNKQNLNQKEVNISNDSSFFCNKNLLNFDIFNTNKNENLKFKTKIFKENNSNSKKSILQSLLFSNSKIDKCANYGERLFFRGKIKENTLEKKKEIYKKEKQIQFEKNCTFSPQLNKNSLQITVKNKLTTIFNKNKNYNDDNNNNNIHNNFTTCDILKEKNESNLGKNLNSNKKIQQVKSVFDSNKNNNNINKKIEEDFNTINNNNDNDFSKLNRTNLKTEKEIKDISKRLYDQAEIYKNKKTQLRENFYSEKCSFSPDIIKKENDKTPSMTNFFSRLQNWVDKRNDKFENDYEKYQFDEITGKRLFSPQINKSRINKDEVNIL